MNFLAGDLISSEEDARQVYTKLHNNKAHECKKYMAKYHDLRTGILLFCTFVYVSLLPFTISSDHRLSGQQPMPHFHRLAEATTNRPRCSWRQGSLNRLRVKSTHERPALVCFKSSSNFFSCKLALQNIHKNWR